MLKSSMTVASMSSPAKTLIASHLACGLGIELKQPLATLSSVSPTCRADYLLHATSCKGIFVNADPSAWNQITREMLSD